MTVSTVWGWSREMARPRAFRYFFSWSRLDNSCCLHTHTHTRRGSGGMFIHSQRLRNDQICVQRSFSEFDLRSFSALSARMYSTHLSLLSDTPTFGEVHLSSTACVCSVGDRRSVCVNLPSFVIARHIFYSEYCSCDCCADNSVVFCLSCECVSYFRICSSCLACSSATSISVTS